MKSAADREGIFRALMEDRIDVIATDHAPHAMEEKAKPFFEAPSGGPLIQHSLVAMLEFYHQGKISIEKIVQKMAHHPAILFRIKDRGFIREGYWADLVLVDMNSPWTVSKENTLAKCGWSPFEGNQFRSRVYQTIVSGEVVYDSGKISEGICGQRLEFLLPN